MLGCLTLVGNRVPAPNLCSTLVRGEPHLRVPYRFRHRRRREVELVDVEQEVVTVRVRVLLERQVPCDRLYVLDPTAGVRRLHHVTIERVVGPGLQPLFRATGGVLKGEHALHERGDLGRHGGGGERAGTRNGPLLERGGAVALLAQSRGRRGDFGTSHAALTAAPARPGLSAVAAVAAVAAASVVVATVFVVFGAATVRFGGAAPSG